MIATEWKKVKYLEVGMKIAVPRAGVFDAHQNAYDLAQMPDNLAEAGEGDILWDEIVSIQSVGVEQVWDIEVEGTHNFVAGHLLDGETGIQMTEEEEKEYLESAWKEGGEDSDKNILAKKKVMFGGLYAHNTYINGGMFVGANTSDYEIASSSNGAGSATLYIGNKAIATAGSGGTISGTQNYLSKFTADNVLGNSSVIYETAGNIGLGTTIPAALLTLSGSSTARASMNVMSGVAPTSPNIGDVWFDGSHLYFRKDGSTSQDLLAGSTSLWTDDGSVTYLGSGGVASGDNVGIGTTAPGAKLDVTNTFRVLASTAANPTSGMGVEILYNSTVNLGEIISIDRATTTFKPIATFASLHAWSVGASEKMRLDANGDLGIGTTNPVYKLEVNGTLGVGSTAYFASNVGIGTTAPGALLHVAGNAIFAGSVSKPVSYGSASDTTERSASSATYTRVSTLTVNVTGGRIVKGVSYKGQIKSSSYSDSSYIRLFADSACSNPITNETSTLNTAYESLNYTIDKGAISLGNTGNVNVYVCMKSDAIGYVDEQFLSVKYDSTPGASNIISGTNPTAYTTTSTTWALKTTFALSTPASSLPKALRWSGLLSDDGGTTALGLFTDSGCTRQVGASVAENASGRSYIEVTNQDLLRFGSTGNPTNVYVCASNSAGSTTTIDEQRVDLLYTDGVYDTLDYSWNTNYYNDLNFANNFSVTESSLYQNALIFRNAGGNDIMIIDKNGNLSATGRMEGADLTIGNGIISTLSGNVGLGTTRPVAKLSVMELGADASDIVVNVSNGNEDVFKIMGNGDIKSSQMDTINETLSQQMDILKRAESDIIAAKDENIVLAGRLDDVTGKMSVLDTTVTGLGSQVAGYGSRINNLAAQNSILETNLQDANISNADKFNLIGENIMNHETRIMNQEMLNADQETRIKSLEGQMALLEQENQAVIDFAKALETDKLVLKDDLGNVDLGTSKLEAGEVVAGAFTVKVTDEERKTVGTETIHIYKDEDLDGIDDNYPGNDGKSVKVLTKAVTSTSKIFVTPEGDAGGNVWVEKKSDGDGGYEGFVIKVSSPVEKDIKIDWFIVEER